MGLPRRALPLSPSHARQFALAYALRCRLERGEFIDCADMARSFGFTRACVTQPMDLHLFVPEVQEEILFLGLPPAPSR